jgi:CheY-like chemotaxis protein
MTTKMHPCGHILIVEDNPDTRETLADFLAFEGYAVRGAANGQEALTVLQKEPLPDLILLDLMMPVMDGCEFRRRARLPAERADRSDHRDPCTWPRWSAGW